MAGCYLFWIPLVSTGSWGTSTNYYPHLSCPGTTHPITYLDSNAGILPSVEGVPMIDDTFDSVSPSVKMVPGTPLTSHSTSWTDSTGTHTISTVGGKITITTKPSTQQPSQGVSSGTGQAAGSASSATGSDASTGGSGTEHTTDQVSSGATGSEGTPSTTEVSSGTGQDSGASSATTGSDTSVGGSGTEGTTGQVTTGTSTTPSSTDSSGSGQGASGTQAAGTDSSTTVQSGSSTSKKWWQRGSDTSTDIEVLKTRLQGIAGSWTTSTTS